MFLIKIFQRLSYEIMLLIVFALLTVSCSTQNDEPVVEAVNLDWRLADGEVIAYKTALNQIDAANASINIDWTEIFGEIPSDDTAAHTAAIDLFGNLNLPEVTSLISILERNEQGNVAVRMIFDEITPMENQTDDTMSQAFGELMQSMVGTVQLRGELYPDGSIASFYLEQRQRNLLAMFFELPAEPVQVGDVWQLDVNCISMGAGFISENSNRMNTVRLSELTQTTDGKPLAVIDYLIAESVAGVMQSPFSEDAVPTTMTCSYVARGYFLVDEGRWEQLIGEFTITSTGIMTSNTTQQIALFPLADIPLEYTELK